MALTDFGDWYNKRSTLGQPGVGLNNPSGLGYGDYTLPSARQRCVSSSQCGSGYGCVNGRCVSIQVEGYGSPNSPGNCPGGGNDCNSGSNACQSGPGCGSGSGETACCGGPLNYQSSENGVITVSCDSDKSCDMWCTTYNEIFGFNAEFCAGREVCDPDCEYCSLSGSCEKSLIAESTPCWCDAGARCGWCRACITAPSDARYGECAQTKETQERCKQCATIESYECCGQEVGPLTFCSTPGEGSSSDAVREGVRRMAREKCSELCDNCEQKTHKTYCTNTTGLPDPETLNCPSGIRCVQTGTLDINGVQCVYVEETDISNCDFKPGRWEFVGTQSYHLNGTVAYRTVNANFIQGGGDAGSSGDSLRNCSDGGCYPVMVGPTSESFGQTGPGKPWGLSMTIGGGNCTGGTFACGMALYTSQGESINCNFSNKCLMVASTECGCNTLTYYDDQGQPYFDDHFGPGCSLTGVWTHVG